MQDKTYPSNQIWRLSQLTIIIFIQNQIQDLQQSPLHIA